MKINLYPLKLYAQRPRLLGLALMALLINISTWAWILWQIPKEGDQLVLHYNVIFGVDRVGTFGELLYLPTLGFVILVVNYIVGWLVFKSDRFLSGLLIFSALLVNIFGFIDGLLLVFLNV